MKKKNVSLGIILLGIIFLFFGAAFAQKEKAPSSSQTQTLKESIEKSLRNALADNLKLTNENDALKKRIVDAENYSQGVSLMNNNIRAENDSLRQQMLKLDTFNQRMSEFEARINFLRKENAATKDKIRENAMAVGQLSLENSNLKEKLDSNAMEQDNRKLRENVKVLEKEMQASLASAAKAEGEKQKYVYECALLHYNLGHMFFKVKDYKKSADAFKRSLELYPLNPDCAYNLGIIYDSYLNDDKEAISYYQKYIDLISSDKRLANIDSSKTKKEVMARLLQAKMRERVKIPSHIDSTMRVTD